jgi:protein gp37
LDIGMDIRSAERKDEEMATTKIEWAEKVWNPVTGCTKVSEGCRHCYAERMAKRLAGRYGYPPTPDQFNVTLHPDKLEEPLHWKKPARIFVESMGDLFHKDVPDDFIDDVFNLMSEAFWHTFLILTKRPERMMCILENYSGYLNITKIWPNVWLGVSVEDQKTADERIPWLLKTPAVVRFVSVEPMLGEVNLTGNSDKEIWPWMLAKEDGHAIDWVICGGETGPGARPLQPEWVENLLSQCLRAKVPFFFKQWGEWSNASIVDSQRTLIRVGRQKAGRYLCGQIWDQYPEV